MNVRAAKKPACARKEIWQAPAATGFFEIFMI
jgi:hypothetical protein